MMKITRSSLGAWASPGSVSLSRFEDDAVPSSSSRMKEKQEIKHRKPTQHHTNTHPHTNTYDEGFWRVSSCTVRCKAAWPHHFTFSEISARVSSYLLFLAMNSIQHRGSIDSALSACLESRFLATEDRGNFRISAENGRLMNGPSRLIRQLGTLKVGELITGTMGHLARAGNPRRYARNKLPEGSVKWLRRYDDGFPFFGGFHGSREADLSRRP